jgi:hypothetical protein
MLVNVRYCSAHVTALDRSSELSIMPIHTSRSHDIRLPGHDSRAPQCRDFTCKQMRRNLRTLLRSKSCRNKTQSRWHCNAPKSTLQMKRCSGQPTNPFHYRRTHLVGKSDARIPPSTRPGTVGNSVTVNRAHNPQQVAVAKP